MPNNLRIIDNPYGLLLFCCMWRWSQADLFTSLIELEPLLVTYQRFTDDLEDYLRKEEERISFLKKYLHISKREHSSAMKDPLKYVGNPINAFTLIKRLTSDFTDILESMGTGYEYVKNMTLVHKDYLYPTKKDLKGAALALKRLQETYLLNVTDLSEGILNGLKYSFSSPLSATDCFLISKTLYIEGKFKNSLAWMLEAHRKHKENPHEAKIKSYTEVDIMEFISYTYFKLDDICSALHWASQLVAMDPNHPRVSGNVPQYKMLLKEQEKNCRVEFQKEKVTKAHRVPLWNSRTIQNKYRKLCRGEMMIPSNVSKHLTCRYMTENHPFLRLAPVKIEQHYIKPDVFVLYDVMSDDEIEAIKEMAKPRLTRAEVIDPRTGKMGEVTYRINKIAWLTDQEDKLLARISQRVSDFTGLTMSTAEELQVSIYGIGGYYEPHYDFARKGEPILKALINGNRMATVIFYMSDVEQGGATVFTELGLSVFPVKNVALFFWNLHPSGEGDFATRHAACPVLKGYKWVSTKWIHQRGQELLKPCDLDYQDEGIIRTLPQPVPKSSQ